MMEGRAPLPPRLAEAIADLSFFTDRSERIQALISVADRFKSVPPEMATTPYDEARRVPGCESEAFVWVSEEGGRLRLEFAVLNPQGLSAMALAALLKEGLDGEPPEAAESVPDEVVFDLFGRELSMGKSLGLMNLVRSVKAQAATLATA